jgi:hypothetical protein
LIVDWIFFLTFNVSSHRISYVIYFVAIATGKVVDLTLSDDGIEDDEESDDDVQLQHVARAPGFPPQRLAPMAYAHYEPPKRPLPEDIASNIFKRPRVELPVKSVKILESDVNPFTQLHDHDVVNLALYMAKNLRLPCLRSKPSKPNGPAVRRPTGVPSMQ